MADRSRSGSIVPVLHQHRLDARMQPQNAEKFRAAIAAVADNASRKVHWLIIRNNE
jgi:hypothetical protein